jgi:hypothetical protein
MNTAVHITTDIKQQLFRAGIGNLADYGPLIYPLQMGYQLFDPSYLLTLCVPDKCYLRNASLII